MSIEKTKSLVISYVTRFFNNIFIFSIQMVKKTKLNYNILSFLTHIYGQILFS